MKGRDRVIIGLVGLPGAGKTTVAHYLKQYGFTCVTLSDFIKQEAQKEGVSDFTREILQNYGNRMRSQQGPAILVEKAIAVLQKQKAKKIVIDGIRNIYEVEYLQTANHFILVGVTASPKVRYGRIREKRGKKWIGSYQQFQAAEEREEHLGSRGIGLRVSECFKRAAITIVNEGTLADLHQATHQLTHHE